jgi:hypothetical protein
MFCCCVRRAFALACDSGIAGDISMASRPSALDAAVFLQARYASTSCKALLRTISVVRMVMVVSTAHLNLRLV